jgi:spoIIIJ-associated protein
MAAEKSGEFRGKSVEAAINSGLAALGLAREEAEIEVVRAGSRGLLGIGAEDAIVRISASGAGPVAPAQPKSAPRPEPEPKPEPAATAPKAEGPAQPRGGRSGPRGSRGGSRSRSPKPASAVTSTAPEPALDAIADPEQREAVELGREILLGLLQRMNLDAQVEVVPQSEAETDEEEETSLVLNIMGDDLGLLIGRQSETLQSLQFITRLMVNQQTHSRTDVIIDVNGYKAKRAESLRKLALRTAEQVKQTGRTMALEPMQPAERRIIHLALRNSEDVTTESVGEGSKRKVTIIPKK